MQIDQRGCTSGSMSCIDNLAIDKAVLEDAQAGKKNLSHTCVDIMNAFDPINHNCLNFCLTSRVKSHDLSVTPRNNGTLQDTTGNTKINIGPIKLKQGILQGDYFCVRLYTICLNIIAWYIRSRGLHALS